jgi:N-acetylglutamate synthase-like GNAT family acetyltransferase
VRPARQHGGIGSRLLMHLRSLTKRPMLVGTWSDAQWAIRFYERHGFELVAPRHTPSLLKQYWTLSERQVETSVVLANPPVRPD